MTPLYKKYEIFLKYVKRLKPDRRKEFIKAASNDVIKSLVEIALNILKGTVSLSDSDKTQLAVHKPDIKKIISPSVSLNDKRAILEHNNKLFKKILDVVLK